MRLKRVFPKARPSAKKVELSATPETSEELRWFFDRFPMQTSVVSKKALHDRAEDFLERQRRVVAILGAAGSRPAPEMALPPRPYQSVASEVCYVTGRLLLADELGLGKALEVHEPVLTPTGWTPIGELKVGDQVVDPDGGVAVVQGVFPQGTMPLYRVTMKDGASVLCTDDHLWEVQNPNDRNRKSFRIVTTQAMREHGCTRLYSGQRLSQWFLPLPKPVQFQRTRNNLPLAPYLLGALLGGGHFKKKAVCFSNKDRWILRRVKAELPASVRLQYTGKGVDYRLTVGQRGARSNPLLDAVRSLGLAGHRSYEKFIPAMYLRASQAVRLELLHGLMDTDGDCTKEGTCILNTSSNRLRDDVVDLVRGLGGIASVSTRVPSYRYKSKKKLGRPAHRVNIRLAVSPFSIPRKTKRWHIPYLCRAIASIEPEGRGSAVCIKVSSKRELFITNGHIVTHNTVTALSLLAREGTLPAVIVVPTHLPRQWTREVEKFLPSLKTYTVKTTDPSREKPPDNVDVWIVPYSRLFGWAETLASKVNTAIFDEIHELRREGTGKYAGAWTIASQVTYRMGLSATPIWNYGAEFYAVLGIISPGELGTWDEFSREWCTEAMERRKTRITDPVAFGAWLRSTGLMLRRTRREVGRQLPPVVRSVVDVEWNDEPFTAVEDAIVALASRALTAKGKDAFTAAGMLDGQLRHATGLAKASHVAALVRGIVETSEEPVVLFGWHRDVYDIWLRDLADLKPVLYTGSENEKEKDENLQTFLRGESRVLIMSLRSGSGVDGLQHVCRRVVFGELDWSPGAMEQCLGRVFRDEQDDTTMVYYLVCDQGSDPVILDVLDLKRFQQDGVIDPGGERLLDVQIDPNHVKKLARDILQRRGVDVEAMMTSKKDEDTCEPVQTESTL